VHHLRQSADEYSDSRGTILPDDIPRRRYREASGEKPKLYNIILDSRTPTYHILHGDPQSFALVRSDRPCLLFSREKIQLLVRSSQLTIAEALIAIATRKF
jgi:hypothetical protein